MTNEETPTINEILADPELNMIFLELPKSLDENYKNSEVVELGYVFPRLMRDLRCLEKHLLESWCNEPVRKYHHTEIVHIIKSRVDWLEHAIGKISSTDQDMISKEIRRSEQNTFRSISKSRYETRVLKTLEILRGHIDVVETKPLVSKKETPYLYAFISITADKGVLDRENHGSNMGIHYHYCDKQFKRSDTIITFDQTTVQNPPIHPVVWEKHAEGKAKFFAKAAAWRQKKRVSVFNACTADLKGRNIADYRCPSLKAMPVWPH